MPPTYFEPGHHGAVSAASISQALHGRRSGPGFIVRCPVHDAKTPSLFIKDGEKALLVRCFAGCDSRLIVHELRRLGLLGDAIRPTLSRSLREGPRPAPANDNIAFAEKIWDASVPLPGTLGERYLKDHRGIGPGDLGDLSHALRWNGRIHAVVGLMTDPVTNVPIGVHRTFLDQNGAKTERKMLGRQGVIRLSPDEDVLYGLGLTEGIEDALAILASGWSPVWAATSAGSMARFPVLNGIDALTIFSDADRAGYDAARACADRWTSADKEAVVLPPPLNGGAQQ